MAAMTPDHLHVYYPFGGRVLLLHWYTYEDRGHVVLAKSQRALRATAMTVFTENPNAEIKALCEIDVVAPSNRLEKIVTESVRLENIRSFHLEVSFCLDSVLEAGLALPFPFAECTEYKPSDDFDADEWATKRHYQCENCEARIRLEEFSPEAFYNRYAEAWRVLYPQQTHRDPRRGPSRAARASDDDELWFAEAMFGHHSSGVELKPINLDEIKESAGMFFSDRAMFFFKRVRELDSVELSATRARGSRKRCASSRSAADE